MAEHSLTRRLGYIDALKGLSMLMVVVGHVIIFCTLNYDNEFVRHIVLVNMPLFFFLNGLVIRRVCVGRVLQSIKIMARKLLLPFFTLGFLITIFRGATYFEFILNYFKFGYWYLLVLFQFSLIYMVYALAINRFNQRFQFVGMLVIFLCVYFIIRYCARIIPSILNILIDYYQIVDYIPYFFLGIVIKELILSPQIQAFKFTYTTYSTCSTILLIISIYSYSVWNSGANELSTAILRISIILLLYLLFIVYDKTSNRYLRSVNNLLKLIRRHTLSIYMIQFFLFKFINLHTVGDYLLESNNILGLLLIVSFVSIFICFICVAAEKFISTSRLLSFILLGKPAFSNYARI